MTIIVTYKLRVVLDSIGNSCNVLLGLRDSKQLPGREIYLGIDLFDRESLAFRVHSHWNIPHQISPDLPVDW